MSGSVCSRAIVFSTMFGRLNNCEDNASPSLLVAPAFHRWPRVFSNNFRHRMPFGNVGSVVVKELANIGVKLMGVSDRTGGFCDMKGLPVEKFARTG